MCGKTETYDLLVVGGGINGVSIARGAAVVGQRVLLVEQGDLAQATSSASTKLMHGGLRYLENYEFKLVREALKERATMLRMAPHLVRPLEFRLPHAPSMRPWPIVRIGLWLYDLLALGGGLPRSRSIHLDDPMLKTNGGRGFSYWDSCVDDSRLVVLNAVDAEEAGAVIATRTQLVSASRDAQHWSVRLASEAGENEIFAHAIVNAAGPWVGQVLSQRLGVNGGARTRLVRGSHIVVRRCLDGDHAWLFQQPDGRVVFAIPYLDDFTLVGTTDVAVSGADDDRISQGEIDYLLRAANLYLRRPIDASDIVGRYAGIRPLVDDGTRAVSAVTRDYRLELDLDGAPLLSVFGGKITTARHLAEVALQRLGISGASTSARSFPGGDFEDFESLLQSVRWRWPFLGEGLARRMAGAYGTRIAKVLSNVASAADLKPDFGAGLSRCEVDYLVRHEWARSAEDILWRRTKLGYRMSDKQAALLDRYVKGCFA